MGNDMFNDEQLAHAEIVQKETEDALGWWKERALKAESALAAAERERDEAHICNTIVRERVAAILANWMRPPGGQQAGITDKSISPSTCREILRSLGPEQGSYTYEEWRRLTAERDALLSRPAARVTFICTRCGRNGDYHGEPGGDRCEYCGGNTPAPAPSAKEGNNA